MKRLITYLACATLVASGGYAYQRMPRSDVAGTEENIHVLKLQSKRQEATTESKRVLEDANEAFSSSAALLIQKCLASRTGDSLLRLNPVKMLRHMARPATAKPRQQARPAAAAVPAPFVCDFETEAAFDDNWVPKDANEDGTTWYYDDGGLMGISAALIDSNPYGTTATDDYLVTANPITLKQGAGYVAIEYGGYSRGIFENLEVLYGTSPDVGTMTQLANYEEFEGGSIYNAQIPMDVPAAGDYYFALHAYSDAYTSGVFISRVEINSGEFVGTPDLDVIGVFPPAPSPALGSGEDVKIQVQVGNYGTADVASFKLACSFGMPDGSKIVIPPQAVSVALPDGKMVTLNLTLGASDIDLSAEGLYTVEVTLSDVKSDTGKGETNTDNNSGSGKTYHFGTTATPFTSDFGDGVDPSEWFGEGDSWVYDKTYGAILCDDFGKLYSKGVQLEAGKSYRVNFNYSAGLDLWGMFKVADDFTVYACKVGDELSPIYKATGEYTNGMFVDGEISYLCTEGGVYQFVFAQEKQMSGNFCIRNISITEVMDDDLAISGVSNCPTMLPASQQPEMDVEVKNLGSNAHSGTVTVAMGGNTLATVGTGTIQPGDIASVPVKFALSGVAAGSEANITVSVAIDDGATDGSPADNTKELSLAITDDVLAYDHMTDDMYNEDSAIGVNDGGAFVGGIPIHLADDDIITGISVGWGVADGQEIQLYVYCYDPDAFTEYEGVKVYTLGDMILSETAKQGTETGQIAYSLSPRRLPAGDYLVCVGCSGYCLAADGVNPGKLLLVSEGMAYDQESTGLGTFAIRAIFGDGEPIANDLKVTDITSPDDSGVFSVNQPIVVRVANNGYEEASGSLEVTVNGTSAGKQTVALDGYTSGSYTFEADLSALGDYKIVATVTLAGDVDPTNDSVEKTVTSIEPDPYVMDFESCADFACDGFKPAWTTYDGDDAQVYTFTQATFPMPAGNKFAFMAFNPAKTTPPVTNMQPYGGERFGASFASTSHLNDDWLISPQLLMPEYGAALTMQVKSYIAGDNGLEQYEVCVSTTDNSPESFTVVKSGEAPVEDWTEVEVDLSEYAGQKVYVAIHCTSSDGSVFMVDDIVITKPIGGVGEAALDDTALSIYPNPVSEALVITGTGIESVAFVSMSGAQVGAAKGNGGSEVRYDVSGFAPGMYIAKVKTSAGVKVLKFMVK